MKMLKLKLDLLQKLPFDLLSYDLYSLYLDKTIFYKCSMTSVARWYLVGSGLELKDNLSIYNFFKRFCQISLCTIEGDEKYIL